MTKVEVECIRAVLRALAESDVISEDCHFYADGTWGTQGKFRDGKHNDMCFYNHAVLHRGPVFQIDMIVYQELISKLPPELLEAAKKLEK